MSSPETKEYEIHPTRLELIDILKRANNLGLDVYDALTLIDILKRVEDNPRLDLHGARIDIRKSGGDLILKLYGARIGANCESGYVENFGLYLSEEDAAKSVRGFPMPLQRTAKEVPGLGEYSIVGFNVVLDKI